MAERNTPFIYELINRVSRHPDFEAWQQAGKLDGEALKQLWKSYKAEFPDKWQPGRFYASAMLTVKYIYESWLAIQQTLRLRLNGKRRWVEMVKSDAELVELSGYSLDTIRSKAHEVLTQAAGQSSQQDSRGTQARNGSGKKSGGKNRTKSVKPQQKLADILFETYASSNNSLSQCAIIHLLKKQLHF